MSLTFPSRVLHDLRDGWVVPVARRLDGACDPAWLCRQLAPTGDTLLLESGRHHPVTGRYSFLALEPRLSVRLLDSHSLMVRSPTGEARDVGEPLPALRNLLARYRSRPDPALPPFTGGFAGYIGYEARHLVERLPRRAVDDLRLPWLQWNLWSSVIAVDHLQRCTWVIANAWPGDDPRSAYDAAVTSVERLVSSMRNDRPSAPPLPDGPDEATFPRLQPQMTQALFESMVRRAQVYIRDGDIYQANLSQRFSGPWHADPWALYAALRRINPSPFGAFARLGAVAVAGSSPERLLRIDGASIETRPIAGTRPCGATPQADLHQAVELILSEKERAEHLMLVDLERNDLGRVCAFGSVRVDELMAIEDYSHVLHIVSNVRGRLRPTAGVLDALASLFPGGTITGTPKIRAMEIIDELEPVARGLYTGSIGYVGTNGAVDLNILIRTFVIADGQAHVQVGAGIVADSDPAREYAETLAKGAALFDAFAQAQGRAVPVAAIAGAR